MIDREHWQRLSALIDQALALEPAARADFVRTLAADEPGLARRVAQALAEDGPDAAGATSLVSSFEEWLAPALLQAAPAPAELAGQRLGAWRLEAKIGEGGMGQVWRARRDDGLYQGSAAIKLLRSDLGSTALAARFARERALLARLNHPAIARLLDAGIADGGEVAGQAYLVLELAAGEALNHHARAHAPTLAQRVRLLLRVAEAVEYAHARLVVHRDLKPSNVIVGADGAPKLLDFGIAALLDDEDPAADSGELTRLTGRGLTLGYAAPEQITGAPIGTAADVFSLGVMLYELCCGSLPFGPRRLGRAAQEHAVLHAEPRRPWAVVSAAEDDDPTGPGLPVDAAQVRGDLEAIARKALRKDPAERYPSVRAFADDLQAWLGHRPVSARRDDWRHNTRLWLRRHALLSAGVALVVVSLGAGLTLSLWQRSLAVQAARQSDEVTTYLEDLLASASPDHHGGSWPTVLQLLEKGRAELPARFADSPDTRLRVLSVLVNTYRRMNRLDVAIPLGRELLDGSLQRYGADDLRTLAARFELAHVYHLQGHCDRSLAVIEPSLPLYRALPREHLDGLVLQAVSVVSLCLRRTGQLELAEALLQEERRLIDELPPDDIWNYGYLNHLHTQRVAQGRLRDALAALRQAAPFWKSTDPSNQREIATQQRNALALEIQLGEYDGIEPRLAELIARIDKLLGAGANLGVVARQDLARYRLESGRYGAALQQHEATLAHARDAGVAAPAVLLPLQARVLAARATAAAAPPQRLRTEAQALLAQAEAELPALGARSAEVWLAVARTGLALDDAELAASALARIEADPGLRADNGTSTDTQLVQRKQQLDGQLARLRGDLAGSARLLAARLAWLDRGGEPQQAINWSAALDLAYTRVLAADPQALAALDAAAAHRPPQVPPGHALDAAAAYLRARLAAGRDDDPDVQAALAGMVQAQRRDGPEPGSAAPGLPTGGRAALGGVIF